VQRKNSEDLEIERRVRAYIREEMIERGIGVNEMGRRLGLKEGTLSRILSEQRGFGSGFILRTYRALKVKAVNFLESDPPARFMVVGVPDSPTPGASPSPAAASPSAAEPGTRKRTAAGRH
jgi:transcriptional regulator with XRE-family HTH domain